MVFLLTLELPRFRGHLILLGGGIRNAEIETAVSGRVPPADGRAGPVGANAGGSGTGVRAVGPGHPELGCAAGRDAGERTDGLRTGEREEMRRENRRLREEREAAQSANRRAAAPARLPPPATPAGGPATRVPPAGNLVPGYGASTISSARSADGLAGSAALPAG